MVGEIRREDNTGGEGIEHFKDAEWENRSLLSNHKVKSTPWRFLGKKLYPAVFHLTTVFFN